MPRKARITVPGVVHHIMARGIDGKDIFIDTDDRETFLRLLGTGLQKSGYKCYAWALMSTHYHIVLRTSENPLSLMMRQLNSTYARYYNKKYKRRGYLFQDRFKSIASQDQSYIEELVRYVHLNPIRAGICRTMKELERYKWSGHSTLMGNHTNSFQNVKDIFDRFDKSISEARRTYSAFVKQGIAIQESDALTELIKKNNEDKTDIYNSGCWVIGDVDFVKKVLDNDNEKRARIAKYAREGITLDMILKRVAKIYKIPEELIMRRSRGGIGSVARKVFVYVSHNLFGYPVIETAQYLGISGPAASISLSGGEEEVKNRKNANLFLNLRP